MAKRRSVTSPKTMGTGKSGKGKTKRIKKCLTKRNEKKCHGTKVEQKTEVNSEENVPTRKI